MAKEKLPREQYENSKKVGFSFKENSNFDIDNKHSPLYSVHGSSRANLYNSPRSDELLRKDQLSRSLEMTHPRDAGFINEVDSELTRRGYSRIPVSEAVSQTTDPSILKRLNELPDVPAGKFAYLKKIKELTKILPMVGTVATGLGALGYSDMAGAATDMATGVVGGVEEMGTSPEQKMLDQRYLQRIKSMQQRKK